MKGTERSAPARGGTTLGALAELCGGDLEGDSDLPISGPAGLDEAGPTNVSFLAQKTYAPKLATTRAGAVIVGRDVVVERDDLALVRCDDPERSFSAVVVSFAPEVPKVQEGIAAGAEVHASAELASGVCVATHVTVGEGARIGPRVVLHPGVRIGAHVRIDSDCELHPNVVVYPHTEIGERCVVHAGSVIGSDGFGFLRDAEGWKKTPQVGRVVVEEDVEIGSNVSIDCARFDTTRIGRGTKIDNLVHIAHNVSIGRNCLLIAQVGVAGSSVIEEDVILAGQAGVSGHLRVGKGARVGGGSGVTKNVPAGEDWFGYPAGPRREKLRSAVRIERATGALADLRKELESLRAELDALRGDTSP